MNFFSSTFQFSCSFSYNLDFAAGAINDSRPFIPADSAIKNYINLLSIFLMDIERVGQIFDDFIFGFDGNGKNGPAEGGDNGLCDCIVRDAHTNGSSLVFQQFRDAVIGIEEESEGAGEVAAK